MKSNYKDVICQLLNKEISPTEMAEMFNIEEVDGIWRIRGRRQTKAIEPPSLEDFTGFWKKEGYDTERATQVYLGYKDNGWRDSHNQPIKNWRMKCRIVWFKPENKVKSQTNTPTYKDLPKLA